MPKVIILGKFRFLVQCEWYGLWSLLVIDEIQAFAKSEIVLGDWS